MAKPVEQRPSVLRQVTQSDGFVERRKTARLDIPIRVRYQVFAQEEGRGAMAKDISAGGCLLLAEEDIPLDSTIEFEIFLGQGESESLKLRGRIARLNESKKGFYEYGVAFDALSSEARRLFADYLFAKMYELIGLSDWPTAQARAKRTAG